MRNRSTNSAWWLTSLLASLLQVWNLPGAQDAIKRAAQAHIEEHSRRPVALVIEGDQLQLNQRLFEAVLRHWQEQNVRTLGLKEIQEEWDELTELTAAAERLR